MFLFHDSICQDCGNVSRITDFLNFRIHVQVWVPNISKRVWWNPFTWNAGSWVDKAKLQQDHEDG